MKRYIKLYALLAMALFVGSCEDELDFGRDNNKSTTPATIVSGGEIVFGASAAKKSTRTIYGNPFDSNSDDDDKEPDKIELQWLPDDCVQIASPESAGVANGVAEYKVTGVTNSTSDNHPSTATLERTGAAGLQWGNVDEGTPYDFYAVYPSVNQLKKSIPASVADTCGLTADGKLKGYLPNTQTVTLDTEKSEGNNYVFKPNMDYAYMVATEEYFIPQLNSKGEPLTEDQDVTIDLNFSSIVTALKFTIKAGEIGLTNEDEKISTIKVTDLTLYSKSGAELCGAFKCDISEGTSTYETNNAYSGFSQVAMKLGKDGCTLSNKSGSITTTFFLLPIKNGYTKGDLMLRIHYYVGDVPQYMTARLGVDIPVSQMTYINNLTMKPLNASVVGSAWFSALHPNIYVSQVSIPVAANTFANSSYGVTDDKRTQQTLKIEDMWDMGVRGFEMVNTSDGEATTTTTVNPLGDMVASEKTQSAAGTFVNNVKLLRSKQLASFTYDDNDVMVSGDPLILICTYSATDDGYSPARYIQNLFASLDELKGSTYTANGVTTDLQIADNTFVQLKSSSTVKDVMGKICVIVRPGDDERWAVQGLGEKDESQWDPYALYGNKAPSISDNSNSRYGLTKALPSLITSGWWNKILLISDWGMDSWDSWHRRFGAAGFYYYATTATNLDKLVAGGRTHVSQKKYEDQLLGDAAPVGAPTVRQYYYPHDISNGNDTAFVQDMVRIAQSDINKSRTVYYDILNSKKYTVTWKESLVEKKKAIDGLFEKSVATKGGSLTNNIYINNLSGYFIVEQGHDVSWYPAYYIRLGNKYTGSEVFPGNSKGGDYATCASTLTKYVYDILSGTDMESGGKLAEGPWGLVMMDYIGSATNSKDLVRLIMMNNFRFPLAQKPVVQGASVQRIPLSDESVDINKNIMVTWE